MTKIYSNLKIVLNVLDIGLKDFQFDLVHKFSESISLRSQAIIFCRCAAEEEQLIIINTADVNNKYYNSMAQDIWIKSIFYPYFLKIK